MGLYSFLYHRGYVYSFAAYTYLMASGDPEGVTKARNEIIYAAVAIIVALLAVGFDTAIATFLQTGQ